MQHFWTFKANSTDRRVSFSRHSVSPDAATPTLTAAIFVIPKTDRQTLCTSWSRPVCSDARIKSILIFTRVAEKVAEAVFYINREFFKLAQKVSKSLG